MCYDAQYKHSIVCLTRLSMLVRYMYDIDCTAGGFVDDIPLWQADVLAIRGELDKALNLLTQGGHFNCIEYEEFRSTTKKESIFTAFLSRHDENITIALEWAMSVIFDEKVFETETSGTRYACIVLCVYVPLPGKLKCLLGFALTFAIGDTCVV